MLRSMTTVLVDDPTQSMDEEHSKLVSDVLTQMAEDKQLIVASQDEKLLDNLRNSDHVEVLTIDSWSEQGPLIAD